MQSLKYQTKLHSKNSIKRKKKLNIVSNIVIYRIRGGGMQYMHFKAHFILQSKKLFCFTCMNFRKKRYLHFHETFCIICDCPSNKNKCK